MTPERTRHYINYTFAFLLAMGVSFGLVVLLTFCQPTPAQIRQTTVYTK